MGKKDYVTATRKKILLYHLHNHLQEHPKKSGRVKKLKK